jgi:hypothetical protein
VCPFHQQEQEEKYQQQLLHQQQHQEELEKQRHSIQQDLQSQMERKLALQQQEENKWFAYKLREVGIKYVEEYDLVPENLDVFGPALIAALKSRLQDEFSPQMEQAWRKVKKKRPLKKVQCRLIFFIVCLLGVCVYILQHEDGDGCPCNLSSSSPPPFFWLLLLNRGRRNGGCMYYSITTFAELSFDNFFSLLDPPFYFICPNAFSILRPMHSTFLINKM